MPISAIPIRSPRTKGRRSWNKPDDGSPQASLHRLDALRRRRYRCSSGGRNMKNGLYSIHLHMLDGLKGRDSGVLILRDGVLLGGGPYFWSRGVYTERQFEQRPFETRDLEGRACHQPAHAVCGWLRPAAVRRSGGNERLLRDVQRRHGRGVRHRAGRRPSQPRFSCEPEAARRVLKTRVLKTLVLKRLGELLTEACREADNPIRLG